jgi:AraC family transcriptional activator of pyochelin receptor
MRYSNVTSFDDASISMRSGILRPRDSQWQAERLSPGLKLIMVNDGHVRCRLPMLDGLEISGPALCAVWAPRADEAMQAFEAGRDVAHTIITMPSVERLIPDDSPLLDKLGIGNHRQPTVTVIALPVCLRDLCARLYGPEFGSLQRRLYLAGKALEISAMALEAIEQGAAAFLNDEGKVAVETERLKSMLADPPSLAEMALRSGLNQKSFSKLFNRINGRGIADYLAHLRIMRACALLSETQMSISSIAYSVGYTPAHLSVVFRNEFGLTPKNWRKRVLSVAV